MALFSKKPKKEDMKPAADAAAPMPAVAISGTLSTDTLVSPRITEKSAYMAEDGCYVFDVKPSADKVSIARAITAAFGVTPRKIRVVRVVRKSRATRGTNRTGKTVGGKKAYVYLKKGDKIEIV